MGMRRIARTNDRRPGADGHRPFPAAPGRRTAGRWLWLWLALACGPVLVAADAARAGSETSAAEIAALVAALGDDDYARRESAAARLSAIGVQAIDPLLAAAELSGDLEIALRARWLVDTIPLETDRDPPEVAQLLEKFKRGGLTERVQVMHRLLRVDDDGGIEPLARLLRLERSPLGSRVAAALLAREWQPDDPSWPGMRDRILAGLGGSTRPAASFLRAVCGFSAATTPEARGRAIEAATDAIGQLERSGGESAAADVPAGPQEGRTAGGTDGIGETTLRIFERCRLQMLLAAGRREDALAASRALLLGAVTPQKDADTVGEETAVALVWLVERGLPEAVDILAAERPALLADDPLVAYAAGVAERARGAADRADARAAAAFANPAGTPAEFVDRLQTAVMLAKWGAADWAAREYTSLMDDPKTPPGQFALAAIMFAEFLHEQEREGEAADCLERLMEGRRGDGKPRAEGGDAILQQIGRDPAATRSRMHFFRSCAAALAGDAAARRNAIEASLKAYGRDVDALIALYGLPDNSPKQKEQARDRVRRALVQIDNEIQALPDESNGYNEYAWLVANTEGDIQKATRYSKQSLNKSFDSSSYLDTLAHCQAAAGRTAAAVRTQSLALRQEPHNRAIRKNLERFQALPR